MPDHEKKIRNMEKRLVTQDKENALVEMIIDYAKCHKFTMTNIEESVQKVMEYMANNAVLE